METKERPVGCGGWDRLAAGTFISVRCLLVSLSHTICLWLAAVARILPETTNRGQSAVPNVFLDLEFL
jgi:hypothetical protein